MSYKSYNRKIIEMTTTSSNSKCQSERDTQLRDIATSGNDDAAECAASDAFKEFPNKVPR